MAWHLRVCIQKWLSCSVAPMPRPPARWSAITGKWLNFAIAEDRSAYPCLKCKRHRMVSLGFNDAVVQTLRNTHARCCSACKVNCWAFKSGMRREKLIRRAAQQCALFFSFFFPQLVLERALSHSTIKVYVSAISACHEGFGERLVSNILPWIISNKASGGNVWRCAPLHHSGNGPWFCQRPFSKEPVRAR